MSILEKIVKVNFDESNYYKEEFSKEQICLHHTVSGPNADGVINWWKTDGVHVGTCIVIDGNGIPYQCFSSKYWCYSLGIKSKFLQSLNLPLDTGEERERHTIGIEICNWGALLKDSTGFHPMKWDPVTKRNIPNTRITIPDNFVQIYETPFRDFIYFEKYKSVQLETVHELLLYWNNRYNITLKYNPDMWDISLDALNGKPGVWTHVSFRPDKSDLNPQPEVVQMLQSF